MFNLAYLQDLLQKGLPGSTVQVTDLTGTGDHFEATVISSAFEGKGLVERHRMVYAVAAAHVGKEIHALSLKTFTPNETQKN